MKHTLGPWLVRYTAYQDGKGGTAEYSVVHYRNELPYSETKDEFIARNLTEGDARLIAAAPEMLKALLCINAVLNQNKTFPEDLEYIQRVANDAINKAVGEE